MQILFLGTSHGVCEKDHFCSSAVLTVEGVSYLIDAGAPVNGLMMHYGIRPETVKAIFITHNHSDHMQGLPELMWQVNIFPKFYPNAYISTYVPHMDLYKRMWAFLYNDPDFVGVTPFYEYKEGLVYEDERIRVSAFPTMHIPGQSYGFLIEAEGKRLVFGGDMIHGFTDYPAVLTETETDLAVIEGAHTVLSKPETIAVLEKTKTKRMLINHLYDVPNPPEAIATLAAAVADRFPVQAVRDGDRIEL